MNSSSRKSQILAAFVLAAFRSSAQDASAPSSTSSSQPQTIGSSTAQSSAVSENAPIAPLTLLPPVESAAPPAPVTFEPFSQTPSTFYGASENSGTSAIGAPANSFTGLPPSEGLLQNPLRWGPFTVHPHLGYIFTYGNGINRQPGEQENTAQNRLSPGIAIVSRHLTLDYTPSLTYYSGSKFQDHTDHNASLAANFSYGDWQFSLSQTYANSSSPLVETAAQTQRESFGTALSAHYRYSDKTSFDLTASQQIQSTQGFQNSRSWSTMEWANYRVTDHTTFGVGAGGGYVDVDLGSNMSYEQLQGRVSWVPGPKFSLNLNGGAELRQFLAAAGSSDRINPIMGASASYRLFEFTTLGLQANRSVNTSLFANQITEDTSVSASISQRFFGKLNFSVSGGFRTSDYQSSVQQLAPNRSDDYTFISTSLGTKFLKKGTASIFYQHNEDSSTDHLYSFASDQYGFSLAYRF